MSKWPSVKAKQVLSALLSIDWKVKRHKSSSHHILSRPDYPDYVFAFHDNEEIGPRMLARIAKYTELKIEDL
ncbi:MAG: type II toxin-antitoxin system HicA family toxin [Nitrospirae bacterium]|nr:type II toxin-antitoxin system HicA family toxin [Nitrospirota bacterium]